MLRVKAYLIALCLAGVLPGVSCFASSANTEQCLQKYGDDLANAWTQYGKDNQKTVREQNIADLTQQFTREIKTLDAPPHLTVDRCMSLLIDNAAKVRILLKFDKMQSDRVTYLGACCETFKRELTQASDFKTPRTNEQAFELLMTSLSSARDGMRTLPLENRTIVYQAISTALADIIKTATPPARVNPAEEMDQNLKEVRRRFATGNPELEASNRPIITILETNAKTIEQQSAKTH